MFFASTSTGIQFEFYFLSISRFIDINEFVKVVAMISRTKMISLRENFYHYCVF